MSRLNLTERAVAKLQAPTGTGKQTIHWDSDLKGFGLLCSGVTNAKTYVVQRTLPDGRTRRVTIGSVAEISLKVAREQAAATLLAMRQGRDPKAGHGGTMNLQQALDAYLQANSNLRERSRIAYRYGVERYLAPWLDRPLSGITPEMVESKHRAIAAEVAASGQHSGRSAANGAMRSLRVLWNFTAERDPAMGMNPVRRLKRLWHDVPRRERLVKADELPAFYEAVMQLPNPIHRDYLLLLLFTGLRRTEGATLTWDDVDFAAGVIRLPAVRMKAGRKLDLPMTDIVRDLLVGRGAQGRERYVFPSDAASRHLEEPKFPLKQVAGATGIRVSAHDLRRTYITVAESADISPLALKALVAHSLGGDVTAGYVQMTIERLREPAQRVADRLKNLCGIAAPAGVTKLAR